MEVLRQVCGRPSTAAVLQFACHQGEFRADDVIRELGLTRSTSLQALDALVAVGLATEVQGEQEGTTPTRGRPARRFQLNAEAGAVVGLEVGGHRISAVAANLSGVILAEASASLAYRPGPPELDVERRQAKARDMIDHVLREAGVPADDVACLSIGVPAPVNAEGQSPEHPLNFWQHMNAQLAAAFADDFPAVRLENDAALAAVAEGSVGAAAGCEDFVALLAGWRFGAGVYLGGRLVRGAHGGVGEMAGFEHVADVGDTWGLKHLTAEWVRANVDEASLSPGHPWRDFLERGVGADRLLAHAVPGDPVTGPVLEMLADRLARICGVMATFYDPAVIVVCGAVADVVEPLLKMTRERIAANTPLPVPKLVASSLGARAVSVGAASAAREVACELVLPWALSRRERDIAWGKEVVPNPLDDV